MKHLKRFNEGRSPQIWKSDEAKEVLSKMYDIKEEVSLGSFSDFLVPIDQYIEYAEKYNGDVAGNRFQSLGEFKNMIEEELDSVISPVIYIAPYWFGRSPDDLLSFRMVYADTVYIQISDFFDDFSVDDQHKVGNATRADECGLFKSESGKIFLRIWWD